MGGSSSKSKKKDGPLEEWEKDSGRRVEIGNEILSTEQSYVASLEILVQEFAVPLRERAKGKGGKPILKADLIKIIFSNVETLLEIHRGVLARLQEECNQESRQLGSVLLEQAQNLKHYTNYINNYNDAINTLCKAQQKFPKFEEFLQQKMASEVCRGLALPSFLIMPVQRVPRYVLLYQDLLKNTDERHPDYKNCLRALDDIKEIADFINEEKRIAEDMQEVFAIQCSFNGYTDNLMVRGRKFLHEGDIKVEDKKGPKDIHYYMFNDCMVFCSANLGATAILNIFSQVKRWKVVGMCLILDMDVKDLKDRHDRQNAIELVTKKKEYVVLFNSAEEKAAWVEEFYGIRARAPSRKK